MAAEAAAAVVMLFDGAIAAAGTDTGELGTDNDGYMDILMFS